MDSGAPEQDLLPASGSDRPPEQPQEQPQEQPPLSKKALNRLKREEHWLANKDTWKAKRKEKKRLQRKKKKESLSLSAANPALLEAHRLARRKKEDIVKHPQRVVIDVSFEKYMSEKDIHKCYNQIQNSYGFNKRLEHPLQLHVTGMEGTLKRLVETVGDASALNWDVAFDSRSYLELFPKDSLVYLSADSPNVLGELDESKVYIVGGIVDHNRQKGLCLRLAQEQGIAHAQLPIGQYIKLASRRVLTINHVFEILANYTVSKDWQQAFLRVIPQRKGVEAIGEPAQAAGDAGENDSGDGNADGDDSSSSDSDDAQSAS